jgi:phosphocarrier protein
MQQRTICIPNKLGLHARAAAKLVRLAGAFDSTVWLARVAAQQKPADAKSIFNVLLLAATQGTEIVVRTEGSDEELALQAVCRLIEAKFGEEE